MQLSPEDNFQDLKLDRTTHHSIGMRNSFIDCDIQNETVDISEIQFEDDEHWLYKLSSKDENFIENIDLWLHPKTNLSVEELLSSNSSHTVSDNQKNFDSRTFTRPKKRFTRPNIEKYNEAIYGVGDTVTNDMSSSIESLNNGGIPLSNMPKNSVIETVKPSFDLSQPSNSYYFENMLANIRDSDSFQNMSPPSLVNSICSTTFANLMENSFIKNDPILREIRDTDFTESILLQDSEAPMFQSITESCSSLNSDTPENFLKKVSRSDTFKKKTSSFDIEKRTEIDDLSNTYQINSLNTYSDTFDDAHSRNMGLEKTVVPTKNLDETYRQTRKKTTFRRSKNDSVNSTFNVPTDILGKTESFESLENLSSMKPRLIRGNLIRENTIEELKKSLSGTVQITDMNRLSYCLDGKPESEFNEIQQLNKTIDIKRSSISTGSSDSLDRMSNMSNSSRGSNRMLSVADVDAIVEMQERSLQQVMSTPKVNTVAKKFWPNNCISPITSVDHLSDSDVSSNEDYKSVRSSMSKNSLLGHYSQKSLDGLNYLEEHNKKIKSAQTTYKGNKSPILRKNDGTIHYVCKSNTEVPPAPVTNLRLMDHKLKSSYTNLKPMNSNLPVAPPINSVMNVTKTLIKTKKNVGSQHFEKNSKVVEVPPMPREKVSASDHVFVKPLHSRTSFLPRPTGIPRPSTRIPAPRSIRPTSSRSATQQFETGEQRYQ